MQWALGAGDYRVRFQAYSFEVVVCLDERLPGAVYVTLPESSEDKMYGMIPGTAQRLDLMVRVPLQLLAVHPRCGYTSVPVYV